LLANKRKDSFSVGGPGQEDGSASIALVLYRWKGRVVKFQSCPLNSNLILS
jgi:hypothetical protein